MSAGWLLLEGDLVEDSTSHTAVIDSTLLSSLKSGNSARLDPTLYNYQITISAIGTATSVTVEGMGAGGTWTQLAASKTAAATANEVTVTGVYQQIRLTWTGGTPNGAGRASFYAARKFNGVL